MKKLLSVLLILVTLVSVAAPAAAADCHSDTVSFGSSMTEEEFRNYADETDIFSFSDSMSVNLSAEVHEKGYYYTHLLNHTDNTMLCAYEVTDLGLEWKYSGAFERYVWTSIYHIDLDSMLGTVKDSEEYNNRLNYYMPMLYAGIWGCRYDDPAKYDKYTNTVSLEWFPSTNNAGVITNFDVYVVLEVSEYYQESYETARDQEVAQIVAEANKKGSQYEALLYIHDYLVNSAEYHNAEEALDQKNYSHTSAFYFAHSSFGVLNRDLGVCESYAKAFKIICDRLNNAPECAVFSSNTHMWNLVLLDGEWYCVDATWDDPIGGSLVHTYFLCEDPDLVDIATGSDRHHIPVTKFGFTPTYATEKYHFHSLTYVAAKAATESATGLKAHYKCNGCEKLFTDAEGKNETTLAALTIPKLQHSHSLQFVAQIDPTETSTGRKAHYKCTGCGKLFTDSQGKNETTLAKLTIDALGITVAEPKITVANISGGVKISWNAVNKAEKYYVYRRASGSSTWKKIKETTASSYVDTAAASGSTYQYAVKAVRASVVSGYSNVATMKYLAGVKPAVKNTTSGIAASWSKVTGATGYLVYRREKTSSGWTGWTKLATTKSLSYADTTAVVGKDYQYVVKAYSGSYKAVSISSATVRRLKVGTVKTAIDDNTLKTTWAKVAGATDYVVYRSQLSGSKWTAWEVVGTTTKTTYADKNIKSGVTYKYCVRARCSGSQSVTTTGNSLKMLTMPKVTATASTKTIVAKWGKVTGATGYIVYRREKTASGWSGWTNLGKQTALTYTDKKVKNGVQYQYTVKAYSGSVKSDNTASAVACILSTPKVTNANKVDGVQVSWNVIKGAESYVVYRSDWKDGKWTAWAKIATTTTATSVLDKKVSSGAVYRYCARAIAGASKSSYTASASFRYLSTPVVSAALGNNQINVSWKKITGASGYIVYRREKTASGWSSWTNLGKQTALSYTDKNVTGGGQYQYTVKAYRGSMVSATKASATVSALATPVVTVQNSLEGVVAKWGKITSATSYKVYRRELSGSTWGAWQLLTTTTGTSYTDTACESGKTYQYMARAVQGDMLSGYTASASIMFLDAPVIDAYAGGVYWDPVEGADQYYIYRRVWYGDTPSAWTKIATVGKTSFYADPDAQSGYENEYTVRAVNGTNESVCPAGEKAYYLGEADLRLSSSNGQVHIEIIPVNGATGYILQRYDGTKWTKIDIGNQTSYIDRDVVAGKTYEYFVQANRGNMNAAPSTIRSIKVLA